MKKASFFMFFLLIGLYASAQTGERILISGSIEVPLGDCLLYTSDAADE